MSRWVVELEELRKFLRGVSHLDEQRLNMKLDLWMASHGSLVTRTETTKKPSADGGCSMHDWVRTPFGGWTCFHCGRAR